MRGGVPHRGGERSGRGIRSQGKTGQHGGSDKSTVRTGARRMRGAQASPSNAHFGLVGSAAPERARGAAGRALPGACRKRSGPVRTCPRRLRAARGRLWHRRGPRPRSAPPPTAATRSCRRCTRQVLRSMASTQPACTARTCSAVAALQAAARLRRPLRSAGSAPARGQGLMNRWHPAAPRSALRYRQFLGRAREPRSDKASRPGA